MVDGFHSPRAKRMWERDKKNYAMAFEEGVEWLLEQQAQEEDYLDDLEQSEQLLQGGL